MLRMTKEKIFIAGLVVLHAPHVVFAQANPLKDLQSIGKTVYGTERPRPLADTIGSVVQALLGFVGIIFLILIIWGGVQWMMSGGNEKKIEEAKKRILHASIGLTIVLISYAVARFIVYSLQTAASSQGNTSGTCGGTGQPAC